MQRDRNWIELNRLEDAARWAVDANAIEGEPEEDCVRHCPIGDRSGQLWLPGPPPDTVPDRKSTNRERTGNGGTGGGTDPWRRNADSS